MDLKEMRNQRGKAIADARALVEKAEEEKRDLSQEEQEKYDKYIDDAQKLGSKIESEEGLRELERESAEKAYREKEEGGREEDRKSDSPLAGEEYRAAYEKFMRGGREMLDGEEIRALSAGTGTEGGYLIMPEQMVDGILQEVDNLVYVRQAATKFRMPSADSLGVPALAADPADADWTTELQTGNLDSTMAFGKRELKPNPFAKRIKVSRDLLMRMPGVEAFVRSRLAYKFAVTEEQAYISGSGDKRPLGLFTASNDGISTSRDVSTDNTATSMTFDGLLNCKYSLKGQYWSRASWMFHRDALKQLAKLKYGDGTYIWRESPRAGEPDMLLGLPLRMSEYVPNTFTTGLYVGILGDFSFYWIVDVLDMELQRLVELYAESNQIGLIGRKKGDGMPVLEEAFARVTLG